MFALLGRHRGLAQPERIIRRVLLTAIGQACEHDQMMPDHRRGDQAFDIAMPEPPEREFPKHLLVVAEHADLPENVPETDQDALDIGPALLLRRDRQLAPT